MVHKSRARSSGLFLMELNIAILFFSVASAVCLEFFVKSHLLSLDSDILTRSVNECSNVAEIICTSEGLESGVSLLQQQYPLGKYPDSGELTILINSLYSTASSEDAPADKSAEEIIHIFFDDTFSQCRESSAFYIMNIHLTCKEQMIHAVLQIYENTNVAEKGEPVYLMEAKHHIARRTEK